MEQKTHKIAIVVLCILLVLDFGLGGYVFYSSRYHKAIHEDIASDTSSGLCSDMTLPATATCLKNDLKKWYYYNMSNAKRDLKLDELKSEGGVCWQYAEWYKYNFIALGFEAETYTFEGSGLSHEVTLAWTKNLDDGDGAYCIADQTSVFCNELEAADEEEYDNLKEERLIFK